MSVPLLVTMDLEIAEDHDFDEQRAALDSLRSDFWLLGVPLTVFSTSDAAERFSPEVRRLHAEGHEVGCHGLGHAPEENYARLPAEKVWQNLSHATHRIRSVTHETPRCFRGPFMTTSPATQKALIAYGYLADFSVCPQRIDVFNGRGGTLRWLTAPRIPYHPSEGSAFRRGRLPLIVVPMSCLGAPFISGLLYLIGLVPMKVFFRMLLEEARHKGCPIVYLFHSYEFAHYRHGSGIRRPWLHHLYLEDRARRYALTLALLRYMLDHRGVTPMAARGFLERVEGRLP